MTLQRRPVNLIVLLMPTPINSKQEILIDPLLIRQSH